ncbi:MAG: hypothetical protein H0T05_01670 [Acidobacteria bacterium]|nr:hypothetical protein [Acidobacteriota bacterium]MBA3885778.1 hypothetical protein [Acidobacteriota bacterium]
MKSRGLPGLVLALALTPLLIAQTPANRKDADAFQAKLTHIVEYGNVPPPKAAKPVTRHTKVSDAEVNAYLRIHATEQIPLGVVDPTINAMGDGRVSGSAIVDLDAVRKSKERGWMDPMGYLTGRMPLTASGRLTTKNGVGRFELESAEVSGVPLPKTVLQELLTYYSRTPDNPSGINMDDPFELPSRIKEIQVARGSATIVQ